jgi:membrane protease YdiL (CAAX protease family)
MEAEGRESGVSALRVKRWFGGGFNTALPRFAQSLPRTIAASPELFLPVACLFVWQVTATAVKPAALGLALPLTLLLLAYGYRVLGRTKWICRIGWVPPRRGFWIYSFLAGAAAAAGIWSYAMILHQPLGRVPPPYRVLLASASGPMIEEMLFRGILFWLILEFLGRRRAPRLTAVCTTVLLTAILFALSHNDRNVPRLYATVLTGVAFGWMRAQSGSTAAAALMHAVYNFVLSSIATLST